MDYANGKIYKILNSIDDEIYVGSTCQALSKRMSCHRKNSVRIRLLHLKLYKHMTELGCEHFYIELIESYPCNSIEELRAKEGEYIRAIGTLNDRIAGRNSQGWYQDYKEKVKTHQKLYNDSNKEHIKEANKAYYELNKEQISERRKQYRDENKEKIQERMKTYYELNKDRIHKQVSEWRLKNAESFKAASSKWYEDNKTRILKRIGEKVTCECGCSVRHDSMRNHLKSHKHKQVMEQLNLTME